MIGIIEIDEKDVSDDGYIIIEFSDRPGRNGIQTGRRIKTNIKFIEWYGTGGTKDERNEN